MSSRSADGIPAVAGAAVKVPIAVPSDRAWLDPLLIGRNLYYVYSDVSFNAGAKTKLAANNPMRWAVGFAITISTGTDYQVAPWSDVNSYSGRSVSKNSLVWYDFMSYGPLVQSEWWAIASFNTTARIIEVVRRAGG